MKKLERLTNQNEILSLLNDFDEVFPHLKEKVSDYNAYALKLKENAFVYKALIDRNVFGILVFYANDAETRKAYISLIGVKDTYQSLGLGKYLLEQCEALSKENGMTKIFLEVDNDNDKAQRFYYKMCFKKVSDTLTNSFYMMKDLGEDK